MANNISDLLSKKRLEGYEGGSGNDLPKILHRYNYNIELSNEFYPLLSIFEVAFRNALHLSWSTYFNDSCWLCNYKKYPLERVEQAKIQDAISDLTKKHKPTEENRIIAELNLGFWVNLFDRPYLEIHKKTVKDLFPLATNKQRDIFKIKSDLHSIRNLRNRVFHHEPIWHWHNLNEFVENLRNYILWMNTDLLLPKVKMSEGNLTELIKRQSLMRK